MTVVFILRISKYLYIIFRKLDAKLHDFRSQKPELAAKRPKSKFLSASNSQWNKYILDKLLFFFNYKPVLTCRMAAVYFLKKIQGNK